MQEKLEKSLTCQCRILTYYPLFPHFPLALHLFQRQDLCDQDQRRRHYCSQQQGLRGLDSLDGEVREVLEVAGAFFSQR